MIVPDKIQLIQLHFHILMDVAHIIYGENGIFKRIVCILQTLNTFSNGFSKNQIKIIDDRIRRIIRQEIRENRDYYYDSADTYNDQQ